MTTTASMREPAAPTRAAALAIFCAVVALSVMFVTPRFASSPDDTTATVKDRLFERGTPYTAASMRRWVQQSPGEARRYVVPVLLPLDVVFLLAFAAFAIVGSRLLARNARLRRPPLWVWLCVPVVYLLADLAEDILLAALMTSPERMTDARVGMTQSITGVKILTATLCFVQLGVLAVVAWRRAPRIAASAG